MTPLDNTRHTPLPWQAQEPDEVDVFVPIIGVRLGDDGEPLHTPTNGLVCGATLFPTEIDAEDYERARANAAFIVRAVNSHYDLLAALEKIEKAPAWGAPERWETTPAEVRQIARAAILKATGGGK